MEGLKTLATVFVLLFVIVSLDAKVIRNEERKSSPAVDKKSAEEAQMMLQQGEVAKKEALESAQNKMSHMKRLLANYQKMANDAQAVSLRATQANQGITM
ncbi:uncharacterized protein LOC142345437 isoform X2 [Convolutriloba macropyga]